MGDFNAVPETPTYNTIIESGYTSSYKKVHGQNPEATFPTGLQAEFVDRSDPGCFDYIFYRGPDSLQPISAEIMGKTCLASDPTIYPSDHKALVVDF